MGKIMCRARKSKECQHGEDEASVFGDSSMTDDGTYQQPLWTEDGTSIMEEGSIVCNACYLQAGAPALYFGSNPTEQDSLDHILSGSDPVRHVNRALGIPDNN